MEAEGETDTPTQEVEVCPDCGARSDEMRRNIFSGEESVIRDHGDWLECKKCGEQWDK